MIRSHVEILLVVKRGGGVTLVVHILQAWANVRRAEHEQAACFTSISTCFEDTGVVTEVNITEKNSK